LCNVLIHPTQYLRQKIWILAGRKRRIGRATELGKIMKKKLEQTPKNETGLIAKTRTQGRRESRPEIPLALSLFNGLNGA
jgi:hypothetical protein